MIDRTRQSARDDLQAASAKIEMVRRSLAGLDGQAFQQADARLMRIEAKLVKLERVVAGQAVAAG